MPCTSRITDLVNFTLDVLIHFEVVLIVYPALILEGGELALICGYKQCYKVLVS